MLTTVEKYVRDTSGKTYVFFCAALLTPDLVDRHRVDDNGQQLIVSVELNSIRRDADVMFVQTDVQFFILLQNL